MYSILVLVTKFVERLSLDFHYFSWIHMSKMKLLKFIPYFCRNILTTQFSNCVILIKANQSRMDHIDLAAKDHWWPHQIQQIESRAHMEKHGVRHTGSRAEPDLVTHGIAALVGGLAGRAQCKRRWKKKYRYWMAQPFCRRKPPEGGRRRALTFLSYEQALHPKE
jgi:hypothetical protein